MPTITNFTIERAELLRALRSVDAAVAKKSTLLILTHYLLSVEDCTLTVSATDMEISLQCEAALSGLTSTNGTVAVPASSLNQLVDSFPQGEISISVDEKYQTTIAAGKSKFTIHGLSAEDYPSFPTIDDAITFELPCETFKSLIDNVIFAACDKASRVILTGAHIYCKDGQLYCEATNTYRLSQFAVPIDYIGEFSFVVPVRSLRDFFRKADANSSIIITFNETQISLSCNGLIEKSRLIDGQFPDINRVLVSRSDTQKTLRISRMELVQSLKRLNVIARAESSKIIFTTDESNCDTINLSSTSVEFGMGDENISCEYTGNEPLAIAINADYLLDVLSIINSEDITMYFSGSLKPVLLAIDSMDSWKYVVMPMQILS